MKNLQDMSVIELKALAYDLINNIQSLQNDLLIINKQIVTKNREIPEKNNKK